MIKLAYNNYTQTCDLVRDGKNITDDPTLETAVLLSLFTRRLALPTDELPDKNGTREGWWADTYSDIEEDKIGSRLWLLNRSKTSTDVLNQAQAYAIEALQWLIEDGVADDVSVTVERQGATLAYLVQITKPGDENNKWTRVWQAQLDKM